MIETIARRREFKARIVKTMISKGIAAAMAESLATLSVDSIWAEYGGQRVYFPKGRNVKADPEQIWEAFTGRNHQELATRFDVTVRRIEQIVAERTAALKVPKGGLP
ncbi:Mor transcription activator family protein [Geothrix sp. 21YS21S-2]|uniref:Mor transcription activator family protein n=1 Tax=Geothrix sp. 21YS21S-2 TaxID=3068893 RepID=UPI0027BB1812|nr:Mor transcription activator family protein [Geothrix sp. 21YS21S-2]